MSNKPRSLELSDISKLAREFLGRLWTDEDADDYANVPKGTHRKLACSGEGPPSVRIGKRRRRYVPQDVIEHYRPRPGE